MTQDATQLGIGRTSVYRALAGQLLLFQLKSGLTSAPRLPQAPQTKRGLSIHVVRSARWFPAVHVSVLVRAEDYMEARSRDDDRDDDVLQWAHVHG